MQSQRNRVLHAPHVPSADTEHGDSRGADTRVEPPDPRIIQIRDAALTAAWWGAVAALEQTTDEELGLVADLDGIVGQAARWLVEYRRRDTERRRRMQEALHGWRQCNRRE
jgi:hypothetical protein